MEDRYNNGLIASGLFILASFTDYLDGMLARRYGVVSVLGQFLDPVSDKMLVSSILIMLIPLGKISAILVVLLLSRDTLIGGLRSVAASQNVIIAAGSMGKWKTAIQMIAIPSILIEHPIFYKIGLFGLWFSLVLSLASGWQYLYSFFKKTSIEI